MCVPFPIPDHFKRNRHKYALGKKTGSGSGDQSVRNPNPCNFRSCRTPHTHLSRLLSQKRVARAGVRAAAAEFEYWPLFHGLLISSGFQAAGGSSGRSFQGAVAPVPGRGLQEIACGARQAEVLLGSGPELPRSRGPAVLGQTRGLRPGVFGASRVWAAGAALSALQQRVTFWRLEGPAQCWRPRGSALRRSWGPRRIFSCGQSKGQMGRVRRLV